LNLIELCESGKVPDWLMRAGVRRLIAQRLADESAAASRDVYVAALKASPIAVNQGSANEQHYELPAKFFEMHLGPRLNYSCGLYKHPRDTIARAERNMLTLCTERAGIADGQRILDLGCGWGSMSLWLAERFPKAEIVALSNSAHQKSFIERRASAAGAENLRVITADFAGFEFPEAPAFDRVVSIEMFEHLRNWGAALAKVRRWLKPDGRMFLHVFAHRRQSYLFDSEGPYNWMGQHFFTGGMMPSADLIQGFRDDLVDQQTWWVDGTHYQRTANQWLQRLDEREHALMPILAKVYGEGAAPRRFQRWRMFYMAVAETFGFRKGTEWGVGQYLLAPR
jgi:cyclopropane-fatty-acyl-phospholipid synthase